MLLRVFLPLLHLPFFTSLLFKLKYRLREKDMLADRAAGERAWYTSGSTAEFERLGASFLGHAINARQHINPESETL